MIETFEEITLRAADAVPPDPGLHSHSREGEAFLHREPCPVFGWSANFCDAGAMRRQLDHKYLNEIESSPCCLWDILYARTASSLATNI